MVATLTRGATKENIQKLLNKLAKELQHKGVDTLKFCGTIKLKSDALEIQKRLRNEWE